MPKYAFHCAPCRTVIYGQRTVENRRVPAVCPKCGRLAEFAFTSSFQLITQPEALKDENKFFLGTSERDRLETMKADDREYEHNWANAETGVKRVTTSDALARQSLNDVFHAVP